MASAITLSQSASIMINLAHYNRNSIARSNKAGTAKSTKNWLNAISRIFNPEKWTVLKKASTPSVPLNSTALSNVSTKTKIERIVMVMWENILFVSIEIWKTSSGAALFTSEFSLAKSHITSDRNHPIS